MAKVVLDTSALLAFVSAERGGGIGDGLLRLMTAVGY